MLSSRSHRLSALHARLNFSNRFIFHPLALLAVLLLGLICISVAPRTARSAKTGESAAPRQPVSSNLRQPAPTNLQGQQALDYLKEQGIYDRLHASIEASSYEVDSTPENSLPRTLGRRGGAEVYRATGRRI